jgi:fructokinase
MTLRIGVDLGGTKIEAISLTERGETLARRRVNTPTGDYTATVRAVADLVATVEQDSGAASGTSTVGVGIPGAISPATGRVKNANSTWLIGEALDRDLSDALKRPVRLANDADCLALSEATDGAAAGAAVVFGVILGTGVGGGVVVNGRPVGGPNAITGEWGHNPLPDPTDDERPGPPCYCGRSGCIETWLSGPGLAADHQRVTGQSLTAAAIAEQAAQGNTACEETLERYAARLAKALAGVINILDPHVIVLGGGLSNVDDLYRCVPKLWAEHVFSDRVDTLLVPPKHGDSSGVRGAAWLWPL